MQVNLGKTHLQSGAQGARKRNGHECLYGHVDPQLSRKFASLHGANFYSKLRKQPFFFWESHILKLNVDFFWKEHSSTFNKWKEKLKTTKYIWHWMFCLSSFSFYNFAFFFFHWLGKFKFNIWRNKYRFFCVNLLSLTHVTGTSFKFLFFFLSRTTPMFSQHAADLRRLKRRWEPVWKEFVMFRGNLPAVPFREQVYSFLGHAYEWCLRVNGIGLQPDRDEWPFIFRLVNFF